MKNEIGRKITSLTLMTIMLAGGVTVGAQGFVPEAFADHNANLFVSAEKTGNSFHGLQIVEVVIRDNDLDTDSRPDVTVNGDDLYMAKISDGEYHAYFVSDAVGTPANIAGLNFGSCTTDASITASITVGTPAVTVENVCTATDGNLGNVIQNAQSSNPPITEWPFVQAFPFSSTVEIEYNRGGGAERTTLDFDDNSEGMTLDRSSYPPGAYVHASIDDHRLNIDPTTRDTWTWSVTGDGTGAMYYNLDANPASPTIPLADVGDDVNSDEVCAECSLEISSDGVLDTVSADKRPLIIDPRDPDFISVSVRETGANDGVFTTTDIDDESTVRILDDANRDTSGVLSYDGTPNGIGAKHYTASITIDAPTDVWPSGSAISVAVVDDDANKNSLSDETIEVSNVNSIIPTLVTNDPFTLGELSDDRMTTEDTTTWVGWKIEGDAAEAEAIRQLNLGNGIDPEDSFVIKGYEINPGTDEYRDNLEDDGVTKITADNIVVVKHDANVESFSERAILSFEDNIDDTDDLTALAILTGSRPLENIDFIVIDFENGIDELRNSLIDHSSANGYNFVNYNVESFKANIASIEVIVEYENDAVAIVQTISGLDNQSGYISAFDDTAALFHADLDGADMVRLKLNFADTETVNVDVAVKYPVVVDFFSFGYENEGEASSERIANQIIRLELEESSDNQGTFEGTLEYVMINQLNIFDLETYAGISPIDDDVSFIVIEDLTGSDAPTVTYFDVGTDGVATQVSAKQDAPSHSGIVTLDVESFKVGDTVTITVEDLDLNVDSELKEIYTVVNTGVRTVTQELDLDTDGNEQYQRDVNDVLELDTNGNPQVLMKDVITDTRGDNWDVVGEVHPGEGPTYLGNLLEVTFDDNRWTNYNTDGCTGLGATGFTLGESDNDSGVFTGTFQIPDVICIDGGNGEADRNDNGELITPSVTGLDIAVNYVDFRDASGETTEVSSDAGVKANTGSVSFDRTVYPVPFADKAFKLDAVDGNEYLTNGDLIVYVSINDPDFDVSASGEDAIAETDEGVLEVSISRDSDEYFIYGDKSNDTITLGKEGNAVYPKLGSEDDPITEIAPDAGIFEEPITIGANNGPGGKILQGDILRVEYKDPTDASGEENTVTDSATFDLRNGVLQSDKSVYIIGSDMILTLIEPDLDLDSSQNETYDLDLIEWDSSAATVSMGNAGGEITAFDPEPSSLRETGPNTGIFQVVVEIPAELDDDALERGEEIELIYVDYGPSGSAFVGENSEDISTTVFTSNFGATVEFDQKIYTWTDKVYMTIVAPDHNFDTKAIDSIGDGDDDEIRISTREGALSNYKLVETGADTGIFTGEITLVGNNDSLLGKNIVPNDLEKTGPTSGQLETKHGDGISLSFEFSDDETVLSSSLIRWNIGEVQWLEASYPASGNGILRIIDPDMSLNPEAVDNFEVDVVSSTDAGGISLAVTETNEATGIFEGTVFFTTSSASSGHRLRIAEGDTVTAYYTDETLPDPYTTADSIDITATTLIGTIVPPLERAPASDLRVVDPFGNSLSTVSPDQQVQVSANLANGQDRDQDFAYLVQIQDGDGVTVHLAWIAGTLSPGQSFSPAVSWTPSESGTYTVTAFVWESVDNPTALSPPVTIDVSVN